MAVCTHAKNVANSIFPVNSWLSFQRLCHVLCGFAGKWHQQINFFNQTVQPIVSHAKITSGSQNKKHLRELR